MPDVHTYRTDAIMPPFSQNPPDLARVNDVAVEKEPEPTPVSYRRLQRGIRAGLAAEREETRAHPHCRFAADHIEGCCGYCPNTARIERLGTVNGVGFMDRAR